MKMFNLIRMFYAWTEIEDRKDAKDISFCGWSVHLYVPVIVLSIGACVFADNFLAFFPALLVNMVFWLGSGTILEKCEVNSFFNIPCSLVVWLSILLADIAILPFLGIVALWKGIVGFTRTISLKAFIGGQIDRKLIEPFFLDGRKPEFDDALIKEVVEEIVRDQIGRDLIVSEAKDDGDFEREKITIISSETQGDTAFVHFSVEVRSHKGTRDKLDRGHFMAKLVINEEDVQITNLFFHSDWKARTLDERVEAFERFVSADSSGDELSPDFKRLMAQLAEMNHPSPGNSKTGSGLSPQPASE